jgi:hypothetical protein
VDFAPREGSFRPWWRGVRVTVHDVPGLRVAGTPLQDAGLRERQRDVSIDIADPVEGAHVRLVRGATVEGKARL